MSYYDRMVRTKNRDEGDKGDKFSMKTYIHTRQRDHRVFYDILRELRVSHTHHKVIMKSIHPGW